MTVTRDQAEALVRLCLGPSSSPSGTKTYQELADELTAVGWTPPAPPPLTEEPTDLAARVEDHAGDLWALDPSDGTWSVLNGTATWDRVKKYGPLRLWESSGE